MKAVALVLAHCNADDVNSSVSPRDARSPLHLASSLGNLAFVQLLIWVSLNLKSLSESTIVALSFVTAIELVDLIIIFLFSPMRMSKQLTTMVDLRCRMQEQLEQVSLLSYF